MSDVAPPAEARVMFSTASSSEEATKVAQALVETHLAACVNIVPGVRSLYFWEGKVQDDAELLLVIKTRAKLVDQVTAKIKELHSYSVPEAIALPILGGSKDYLRWLEEVTQA